MDSGYKQVSRDIDFGSRLEGYTDVSTGFLPDATMIALCTKLNVSSAIQIIYRYKSGYF